MGQVEPDLRLRAPAQQWRTVRHDAAGAAPDLHLGRGQLGCAGVPVVQRFVHPCQRGLVMGFGRGAQLGTSADADALADAADHQLLAPVQRRRAGRMCGLAQRCADGVAVQRHHGQAQAAGGQQIGAGARAQHHGIVQVGRVVAFL